MLIYAEGEGDPALHEVTNAGKTLIVRALDLAGDTDSIRVEVAAVRTWTLRVRTFAAEFVQLMEYQAEDPSDQRSVDPSLPDVVGVDVVFGSLTDPDRVMGRLLVMHLVRRNRSIRSADLCA